MQNSSFNESKDNAAGARRGVCSLAVCGQFFHCLVEEVKDCEELKPKPKEKWVFVDKKMEETQHRTEWCVDANKYRCGRGSMKTPGKCAGSKYLSENLGKMETTSPWRSRFGKKNR